MRIVPLITIIQPPLNGEAGIYGYDPERMEASEACWVKLYGRGTPYGRTCV